LPTDPELLFDGPADAPRTVALAHGAGTGMDSPFLESFAKALGGRGFRVARFEFPYMAAGRFTVAAGSSVVSLPLLRLPSDLSDPAFCRRSFIQRRLGR
jgi:predicted alpha/beta hydrolase